MGEYLLANEAPDVPLIVHRPSIVTPIHGDPFEVS